MEPGVENFTNDHVELNCLENLRCRMVTRYSPTSPLMPAPTMTMLLPRPGLDNCGSPDLRTSTSKSSRSLGSWQVLKGPGLTTFGCAFESRSEARTGK